MFIFYRITNKIRCLLFNIVFSHFFGKFGARVSILNPVGIEGIKNIYIDDDVYIANGVLLAATDISGKQDVILRIKAGCSFGKNNHIYATNAISIGENVLTANNVYISDNTHEYRDTKKAIKLQPVLALNKVEIGEGSWLGQNVCILGASIGKGCVIGANSVVTKDIPDFCVAAGIPAKVIKRYDEAAGKWRQTDKDGLLET